MAALRRHDLVRLAPAAWCELQQAHAGDPCAAGLMARWCAQDWPLIVTRRAADGPAQDVALGLPAPRSAGRLRLWLAVCRSAIAAVEPLPLLTQVLGRFDIDDAVQALDHELHRQGLSARVFGSYGWQALTGLDYLHKRSDLDLAIDVADWGQAEAALCALARTGGSRVRVDGEVIFPGDRAVAWRELDQLRQGRVTSVLVKRTDDLGLVDRRSLEHAGQAH